jgi:uncharacterized membrane protein YbhN (UPF0104 family)
MKKTNLLLICIGVLMLAFTLSLDLYIFNVLQAIDLSWAYFVVLINIMTIGLEYTIYSYLVSMRKIHRTSLKKIKED